MEKISENDRVRNEVLSGIEGESPTTESSIFSSPSYNFP
jgi:hypothetical protein